MNPLYASETLIALYEEIGYKRTWINNVIVGLGHNEPVYLADLQNWMYETHGLWCEIGKYPSSNQFDWYITKKDYIHFGMLGNLFDNPLSALESALLKAGEIIKEGKR